jgi:hypothetical protein
VGSKALVVVLASSLLQEAEVSVMAEEVPQATEAAGMSEVAA